MTSGAIRSKWIAGTAIPPSLPRSVILLSLVGLPLASCGGAKPPADDEVQLSLPDGSDDFVSFESRPQRRRSATRSRSAVA